MRIGILGTRGVPNHYGGFEQFAEYLSVGLVKRGHEVFVYNSSNHPYQKSSWNGVNIIHSKDYEDQIGTIGQFIYDFNCIRNAKKQNFDVLLQLGYTSNSIWKSLLPKDAIIVTNMDGLEWMRSKYSKIVQLFLRKAEKWAAESSDHLIADSIGIQNHLKKQYNQPISYISYGSEPMGAPDDKVLKEYGVSIYEYFLLIARMEPENNIEKILDGYVKSKSSYPFLVVGNIGNRFGSYLKRKFKETTSIIFLGGVYNFYHLNNLRYFSALYFHGHSVGGTNPSLLEAMSSSSLIVAHDNIFNRSILGNEAFFFSEVNQVSEAIQASNTSDFRENWIQKNLNKIKDDHSWDKIIDMYENLFIKLAGDKRI